MIHEARPALPPECQDCLLPSAVSHPAPLLTGPAPSRRRPSDAIDAESLTEDLLATWLQPMSRMAWRKRLELLEEVERLLHEEAGPPLASSVSQDFTAKLIERLDAAAIGCAEQALVYLNSSSENHRNAARLWLATA